MKFTYWILLITAVGLSQEWDLGENSIFYKYLAKMDYNEILKVVVNTYPLLRVECKEDIAGKLTSMVSIIQSRLLDTNDSCEEKTKFFAGVNEMIDKETSILKKKVGQSVVLKIENQKDEEVKIQKDTIKKVESLKNYLDNCKVSDKKAQKLNISYADQKINEISQQIKDIETDKQCLLKKSGKLRKRAHRPDTTYVVSSFSLWKLLGLSEGRKITMKDTQGARVLMFIVTLVGVILIVSLIVAVFAWIIAHWYVILIGSLITGLYVSM